MVRFLLRYGARVDATTLAGYTPLHLAAQQGGQEIVEILLDSGASPNAVTVDGHTPLAIGRRFGHSSELSSLRYVTDAKLIAEASRLKDEALARRDPEVMQESYGLESEYESELVSPFCLWLSSATYIAASSTRTRIIRV